MGFWVRRLLDRSRQIRADYGPIREEFFGKKMPAHTLVAVTALAGPPSS